MSATATSDPVTAAVLASAPSGDRDRTAAAKAKREAAKPKPSKPTAAKRSTGRKGAAKPKPKVPGKKAAKYPDWLPAAVKRSRVISGRKIGKDGNPLGDMTVSYPGPKQHLFIRKVVADRIEGAITADAILKLTGVKNLKTLTEIASWSAPREALKPMRELSKAMDDGTGWSTGRFGASALVAWIEELRAAEKRS